MNLSPINNKKMNLKENLDVLVAIGVIGIVLMIISVPDTFTCNYTF